MPRRLAKPAKKKPRPRLARAGPGLPGAVVGRPGAGTGKAKGLRRPGASAKGRRLALARGVIKTVTALVYDLATDGTLTSGQKAAGGFRPGDVKKIIDRTMASVKFRYGSNPTSAGIQSGYHEAFVVTDMALLLQKRVVITRDVSALPRSDNAYWKGLSGRRFPERNVAALVAVGDATRTDTARTILSGPGGTVAGHAGSDVSTVNQDKAHNLLRDIAVDVLEDSDLTPGAAVVIAGATTVWSMAPGELASTAPQANQLKARGARDTWEEDRNRAKERVAALHGRLSSAERSVVRKHISKLATAIGGGRELDPDAPVSPRRSTLLGPGRAIAGGDYVARVPLLSTMSGVPDVAPPSSVKLVDQAAYATEPFRLDRP